MESDLSVKPHLFQEIERCHQVLDSSDQEDQKAAVLEELRRVIEQEDCTQRFDGFTPFLYLLHHCGSHEQLVRVAAELLIKVPEKKDDEDDQADRGKAKRLSSFINARGPVLFRTALHYAAGYGYFWLVDQLVAAGAHVQAVDSNNANAHHYACGCDGTLVPHYVKNLQHDFTTIEVREHKDFSYKTIVPLSIINGLHLFARVIVLSPWKPIELSSVVVNQMTKQYTLNISHRAQIMKFLISKMLFHSSLDNKNKSPNQYARQSGYLLLDYILKNQHFEESITNKFFHHGLLAWATIFGHLEDLVTVSD
jgi:ankyrin repeat protein